MVTLAFLDERSAKAVQQGYQEPKWIAFCRVFLSRGYQVNMYEVKSTVSRYIILKKDGKKFKVCFRNSSAKYESKDTTDCDFFVGHIGKTVTTTEQAVQAASLYFNDADTSTMSMQER